MSRLDTLVADLEQHIARRGHDVALRWGPALAGRAALLGLGRRGQTSANGTCRLLAAEDGWLALNLARDDDVELVPALIGQPSSDPWGDATLAAGQSPVSAFVARARLLGLAAAALPFPIGSAPASSPYSVAARGRPRLPAVRTSWRVVDLSALWAGPVAARVLASAGAEVTKVESTRRPDSARALTDFYRWVHPPNEITATVDLGAPSGRAQVAELLDGADVVIESSRPRALEQLGLGPDDRSKPAGQVWLSITGYGRDHPGRDWVAFGDDAAVAGGLVCRASATAAPVFCGDAVADPLTGLWGALAVLRSLEAGGGQLIDLAMSRVAATMASGAPTGPGGSPTVHTEPDGEGGWQVRSGAAVEPVRGLVRERPDDLVWLSATGGP